MKLLIKQLQFKDNNLWWIIHLYPKRNDKGLVDYWDGVYPSFVITRREQIKLYIRLYKQSIKH